MSRRRVDPLLALVESFFNQHLRRTRGASPHTVRAYGHAIRLLLLFLAKKNKKPVAQLELDDITVDGVLAFLDHIETERANSASTRNSRLAAIRAFVEHLLRHDATRAAQYQRVLSLRAKRTRARAIPYLEPEQVRVILEQPDARRGGTGERDRALLLFFFNTGARVAEALAVSPVDLHLTPPRQVRLRGKGGKERICPLWQETAAALRSLVAARASATDPIFRSAHNRVLTRDGAAYIIAKYVDQASNIEPSLRRHHVTPHTMRHSCAVALLQAGVDITVIRDYLGHSSVATTSRYVSTNVGMKRDALEAFWKRAGIVSSSARRWRPKDGLLDFLSSL